jgi:hypothetical protein
MEELSLPTIPVVQCAKKGNDVLDIPFVGKIREDQGQYKII